MFLCRQFYYRLPRLKSFQPLFDLALATLERNRLVPQRTLFLFEESCFSRVSACHRVLNKFPNFQPFYFLYEDERAGPHTRTIGVLSNLGPAWDAKYPQPPEATVSGPVLSEIAKGVPRAFPFRKACITFDDVPWWPDALLGLRAMSADSDGHSTLLPADGPPSAVEIESNWWVTRREYSLAATVPSPPAPPDAAELPPLPIVAQRALQELGKVEKEYCRVILDPREKVTLEAAESRANEVERRWDAELDALAARLPFPHRLPHPQQFSPVRVLDPTGPLKPDLVSAYKPLGYRYNSKASGPGGYVLSKRTPRNNQLSVFFNAGGWGREASALLTIDGLGWNARAIIPMSHYPGPNYHYPIVKGDLWSQVVANSVVAVSHYEETFVPEIESIFAPAPKWYYYRR